MYYEKYMLKNQQPIVFTKSCFLFSVSIFSNVLELLKNILFNFKRFSRSLLNQIPGGKLKPLPPNFFTIPKFGEHFFMSSVIVIQHVPTLLELSKSKL